MLIHSEPFDLSTPCKAVRRVVLKDYRKFSSQSPENVAIVNQMTVFKATKNTGASVDTPKL